MNKKFLIRDFLQIINQKKKYLLSLILLLTNFSQLEIKEILEIISNNINKSDLFFYKKIIFTKKNNFDNSIIHANALFYTLLKYNKTITQKKSKIRILDYGCGNCLLGINVAKKLNQNISYGVDIADWSENFSSKKKNFIFKEIQPGKKIPFDDGFFDLIIISMVLHHIENINFVVQELYRLLRKGGILIIREHDAVIEEDHYLIELQHYIYMYITYNDNMYKKNKNYYSNYKSLLFWKQFFKQNKFKNIKFQYEYSNKNRPEIKLMRQFIMICSK